MQAPTIMRANTVWQFSTAGGLKFGRGARWQLPEQLSRRSLRRPILVTDSTLLGLPNCGGFAGQLATAFPQLHVFDGCQAEPSVAVADAACQAAMAAQADCVIGLGGGSNLDVAKMTAVVAKRAGTPQDYFGFDRVPGPGLPVFACPPRRARAAKYRTRLC